MKRLLLFILVLFGILSAQSFAWNYGCGENIPPDVCGASSGSNSTYSPPVRQYDPPTNYYYLMFTLKNNNYRLIDLKTTDVTKAIEYGFGCNRDSEICSAVTKNDYVAVVTSEDNRVFLGLATTFNNTSPKEAEKYAIKECKKGRDGIKGKNCKLIMILKHNFYLEDKRSGEIFELKVTDSV